jgi:hypothetical protein
MFMKKNYNNSILIASCGICVALIGMLVALINVSNQKKVLANENSEYLSVIEEYSVEYSKLENKANSYRSQIKAYKTQMEKYKEQLETTAKPVTTQLVTTTVINTTEADSDFGVFKSYTDYNCLSRSSRQWELQTEAYTDSNGLRKIGDAYLVALGSYYGTTLGTRYTVTLSNGSVFDIILCDVKQDRHTDSTNRVCLSNGSVLEFYVDSSALPNEVNVMGTVSVIPYFSGSVVSIVQK